MKTLKTLLLIVAILFTLTSCASSSVSSSDPAPYGVDDRFLGMWEQISSEVTIEGDIEDEQSETNSVADEDTSPEVYYLFLPNGSSIAYGRTNDDLFYDDDKGTWYTANDQIFIMDGKYFSKYDFKGNDTVVITSKQSRLKNGEIYTVTSTATLKRSNKHPIDFPIS